MRAHTDTPHTHAQTHAHTHAKGLKSFNPGKNEVRPFLFISKISQLLILSFWLNLALSVANHVYTGPSFAFKLDKTTLEYVKTKTCQIAWNVGLGIELFKHLQVGASYGFGINNLVEKHLPGALNPEVIKVRNNYWTISAAYLF